MSCSQLKYHYYCYVLGMLHLDQDERSVVSYNCDLQKEIRKKRLAASGETVGRVWFVAELWKNSSAK